MVTMNPTSSITKWDANKHGQNPNRLQGPRRGLEANWQLKCQRHLSYIHTCTAGIHVLWVNCTSLTKVGLS